MKKVAGFARGQWSDKSSAPVCAIPNAMKWHNPPAANPTPPEGRSILPWTLMRLEERIVLEGSGAPEGACAAHIDAVAEPADAVPPDALHAVQHAIEHALGVALDTDGRACGAERVLAVSSDVEDAHTLLTAATPDVHGVVFDAQATTLAGLLARIRAELNGQAADSIALATHGDVVGGFQLVAGHPVNLETIHHPEMRAFWEGLAELVRPGGRIDVLACDAAAGLHGQVLMAALEQVTGVDIAASVDATGAPGRGGDWVLETDGVDVGSLYFVPTHLARFTELLAGPTIADTNPSHTVVGGSGPVVLDPGITVGDGGGGLLLGAAVRIKSGFVPGEDWLSLDADLASSSMVTWSYDAATGVLTIAGDNSATAYQALLRTVTYENTSTTPSTTPREFMFVIGDTFDTYRYLTSNGHYYQLGDPPGPATITWAAAQADAGARTLFGLQGYLATITSGAENSLAAILVPAMPVNKEAWLGGSDVAADGVWTWVTGPEAGTQFWQGDGTGSAVNGMYTHWNVPTYPNVAGASQLTIVRSSAWWHDAADGMAHDYFIVEYGGLASDTEGQLAACITVDVVAPNHAPVLDNTGLMRLTAINEDHVTNAGTSVASIIASAGGDRITDYNVDPEGIALTGIDTTHGSWQYSIDGGATWHTVGAVGEDHALLLRSTDLLRFRPHADWNGTVAAGVAFRAWDQSAGSAGGFSDVTTNGGQTAFSTASETASIAVNAVNDAPVLDSSSPLHLTDLDEDAVGNGGMTVADLLNSTGGNRITDVDAGALRGIAVIGLDAAYGTWQYSLDGGLTWLNIGAVSSNHALLLRTTDLLRFQPAADWNGLLDPALALRAWDQTSGVAGGYADASITGGTTPFSAATVGADLLVHAVNDAPHVAHPLVDQHVGDDAAFSFGLAVDAFRDVDAGDILTYTATLADGSALPEWLTFDSATRTFSGQPGPGAVGIWSVRVIATDGHGESAADVFDIVVAHVNHAPTLVQPLVDQSVTAGTPLAYQLPPDAFHDVDAGDTLTYRATLTDGGALPAWLVFDSTTRTFQGTPHAMDAGVYQVLVTAEDGQGGAVTGAFVITVARTAPVEPFDPTDPPGADTPVKPPAHNSGGRDTTPRGSNSSGPSGGTTTAGGTTSGAEHAGGGPAAADPGGAGDATSTWDADAPAASGDSAPGSAGDGPHAVGAAPVADMPAVGASGTAAAGRVDDEHEADDAWYRRRLEEPEWASAQQAADMQSAILSGELFDDAAQPAEFRAAWDTILGALADSSVELTAYLQSAFRTVTEAAHLYQASEQALAALMDELALADGMNARGHLDELLAAAGEARTLVRVTSSELQAVIMAAAEAGRQGSFDRVLDDVIGAALHRLITANERLFIETQAVAAATAVLHEARVHGEREIDADVLPIELAESRVAAESAFREIRKSWDRVAEDAFAAFVAQLVAQHGTQAQGPAAQ